MPHTTNGSEVNPDFREDPFGKKKSSTKDDEKRDKTGSREKKAKKPKQIKSRFDLQREAIDQTAKRMGQFLESNTNKELDALRKVYTDPDQSISAQRAAFRQSQRITEQFQGRLDRIQTKANISQKRLNTSKRVFDRATQNNVVRQEKRLERRFVKENPGVEITDAQRAQFRTDAITHVGEQAGADLTHFQDRRLEFKAFGGRTDRFTQRAPAAERERQVQRRARGVAVAGPSGRLQRGINKRNRESTDRRTRDKLRRLIVMENEGVLTDDEQDFLTSFRQDALDQQPVRHGNLGQGMQPISAGPVPKFGDLDTFAGDQQLNIGVQGPLRVQEELDRIDASIRTGRKSQQEEIDSAERQRRFREFFPTRGG